MEDVDKLRIFTAKSPQLNNIKLCRDAKLHHFCSYRKAQSRDNSFSIQNWKK